VADDWHAAFAGDPIAFKSIVLRLMSELRDAAQEGAPSSQTVKRIASETYAHVSAAEFAARHLLPLGYATVAEFRREGLGELGSGLFHEYANKLAKFDLGVEVILFGYDDQSRPQLLELTSPGRISDAGVLGYAIVGSGFNMAASSLRMRPLDRSLEDLIYRLLEAKFLAETATGVGKTTSLVTVNRDGDLHRMTSHEINSVKIIWEKSRKAPIPEDAYQTIKASLAVRGISDGER
jgi:hypothetical protein